MSSSATDIAARHLLDPDNHGLQSKLVLHRGWHRIHKSDTSKPLENTRAAYQLAATIGTPYAECDVWSTHDDEVVLSHNASYASYAADPSDPRAMSAIASQTWAELASLPLLDGSTPVLLSTVLRDLLRSKTKLVVELKIQGPVRSLARMLAKHPELRERVGAIISFNIDTLVCFHNEYSALGADHIQLCWLLDNPSVAYGPENLDDGETLFDYGNESLAEFADKHDVRGKLASIKAGVNIQYNKALTPAIAQGIRADLCAITGLDRVFVAMWSDVRLDPEFDCVSSLRRWLEHLDAAGSDVPADFWDK